MTASEWTALAEDFRSGHIDPEDWETVAIDRYPGGVEWPRDAYFWPWALLSIAEACTPEGCGFQVGKALSEPLPQADVWDNPVRSFRGYGSTPAHALMSAICLYRATMEEKK